MCAGALLKDKPDAQLDTRQEQFERSLVRARLIGGRRDKKTILYPTTLASKWHRRLVIVSKIEIGEPNRMGAGARAEYIGSCHCARGPQLEHYGPWPGDHLDRYLSHGGAVVCRAARDDDDGHTI